MMIENKKTLMHVGLNIFYQWCYFLFYFHHFRSHHALCCCACCCHVPPISRQSPTLRSIKRPCQLANVVRNKLYGGATLINIISHMWLKFWRARKGLVTPARISCWYYSLKLISFSNFWRVTVWTVNIESLKKNN